MIIEHIKPEAKKGGYFIRSYGIGLREFIVDDTGKIKKVWIVKSLFKKLRNWYKKGK